MMLYPKRLRALFSISLLFVSSAFATDPFFDTPGVAKLATGAAKPKTGADEPKTDLAEFGLGVRSTDWLSPQQQRSGFHLPPGFEIRLFASEPQIAKPLNMAFDDRGRLWVTNSVEYPYPATGTAVPRDSVSILHDTDGDGAADDVTVFASGLNIPMGVLPYGDGCLCFSIPNLLYLRDTDGDGMCDQREIILGPFDTSRDTHGMVNSLRDLGDGWIYACHGFNNQSRVAGTDGHVVTLHSGNTFRFRTDGSRVEHFTSGQVNPFGMTADEWGYLYSADCHSKPITQLVHGACYPSFGRPHDGLGFLPPMVDHLHGSTAISGILFIQPDSPIVPLRGQFISGNVMTSRLNRNGRLFRGATAIGKELPDFLTSDDPWFRPVDIQLGPDGQIYVADFYNKIIGHYEVPLDHLGRDRTSGRIWQIRYTRNETSATGESVDAFSRPTALQRLQALRRLDQETMHQTISSSRLDAIRSGLSDESPHVVRLAAELLGRHGQSDEDVDRLLSRLSAASPTDPVLRQTIRIAIRNLIANSPANAALWSKTPNADLASILMGVQSCEASAAMLAYLSVHPNASNRDELLSHAAKNACSDSIRQCVQVAQSISGDDRDKQFRLLDVLCRSQSSRPGNVAKPLGDWAQQLVQSELLKVDVSERVLSWSTDDGSSWPQENRKTHSGGEALLTSSLGRGEQYTGRLLSDPFNAPEEIRFWVAGHNGFPKEPDHGKNRIRLVRIDTGEVLFQATPPRNDTAKHVRWNTKSLGGSPVRIECIDGDSGSAYAWIGFGKFNAPWMNSADQASALTTSLDWIKRLGLDENAEALKTLLQTEGISRRSVSEIAGTIALLRNMPGAAVTLQFLHRSRADDDLVKATIDAMLDNDQGKLFESIEPLCKRLPAKDQREFSVAWAINGAEIASLLEMAHRGWISREVLADPTVAQAIAPSLTTAEKDQFKALTAGIKPDTRSLQILSRLQATVASEKGSLENGHRLYIKHCAACHQIRGEGAVVGPQLDGVITRSSDRLLEDIVTPDRNVDQAFRTTSFLLDDGRVWIGMVISENANEISVARSNGQPTVIKRESIELRRDAGRSLMPSNFAEVISDQEFGDLIHFLRSQPTPL